VIVHDSPSMSNCHTPPSSLPLIDLYTVLAVTPPQLSRKFPRSLNRDTITDATDADSVLCTLKDSAVLQSMYRTAVRTVTYLLWFCVINVCMYLCRCASSRKQSWLAVSHRWWCCPTFGMCVLWMIQQI